MTAHPLQGLKFWSAAAFLTLILAAPGGDVPGQTGAGVILKYDGRFEKQEGKRSLEKAVARKIERSLKRPGNTEDLRDLRRMLLTDPKITDKAEKPALSQATKRANQKATVKRLLDQAGVNPHDLKKGTLKPGQKAKLLKSLKDQKVDPNKLGSSPEAKAIQKLVEQDKKARKEEAKPGDTGRPPKVGHGTGQGFPPAKEPPSRGEKSVGKPRPTPANM